MITLNDAYRIIDAATEKAEELGVPSNVAVVDGGGNLLSFARMDGAWLGSISIAIDKAFTARAFDMSTADLGEASQPDGALFGINTSNGGRIVIFAGGVPLSKEDEVVGGIGASGGTPEQDAEIAQAGAGAF